MRMRRPFFSLALAALMMAALGGCATTRQHEETEDSDIPWNVPATWEGVPAIPGFSQ